jgi:hypothetical protein
MLRKLWKCCKSSFWRANNGINTNFWVVHPSYKVERRLVNKLNAQDFHQWAKQIKNTKLRNTLKTVESSQSVKLLTCWKFHLAQFRASERQSEHALTAMSTKKKCTCSLCPVCVRQFLVLQTVIPQFTRFSTIWLVGLPQKALRKWDLIMSLWFKQNPGEHLLTFKQSTSQYAANGGAITSNTI